MKTSTLLTALILLTTLNVACEKAKSRRGDAPPAQGSGKGIPGKPQLTNLHKPDECPPQINGEWQVGGSDTILKIADDRKNPITLSFIDEILPSVIDGVARFTDPRVVGDKQTYVGYCAAGRLIYSIETGAELGKPDHKREIVVSVSDKTEVVTLNVKFSKFNPDLTIKTSEETQFRLSPAAPKAAE